MTFRGRLVLAATGAVLVVVVLGSFVTYIVAYNSLIGSADATLAHRGPRTASATPRPRPPSPTPAGPPWVPAPRWSWVDGGTVNAGRTWCCRSMPPSRLPRPAAGRRASIFNSTTVNGIAVRQIVASLPSGLHLQRRLIRDAAPTAGGALQLSVPLTGVNLGAAPSGRRPVAHRVHRGGPGRPAWASAWAGRSSARSTASPARSRSWPRPPTSPVASTPVAPTSWADCAGPSTGCWLPSTPPGRASASWCSTPPTSCAPR